MNVCIAGGTGFIGRHLINHMTVLGHRVSLISRSDLTLGNLKERIQGQHILINLVGSPISVRWTRKNKKKIYESRILSTRKLVSAVNFYADEQLKVFIQVSAVGIYSSSLHHNESSLSFGNNFLAEVVKAWENELESLQQHKIRMVIIRLGVVLDKQGGFLRKILPLFSIRLGIRLKVKEGFPFIHLADLLGIFQFVMEHNEINGIINAVAPVQTTISGFFEALAAERSSWLRITLPIKLVALLMGEGSLILLHGQQVVPEKLLVHGYNFIYRDIQESTASFTSKKLTS